MAGLSQGSSGPYMTRIMYPLLPCDSVMLHDMYPLLPCDTCAIPAQISKHAYRLLTRRGVGCGLGWHLHVPDEIAFWHTGGRVLPRQDNKKGRKCALAHTARTVRGDIDQKS